MLTTQARRWDDFSKRFLGMPPSWTLGVGLGVDLRLNQTAILDARFQRLTGADEDDQIDLSGWDTVVTIRWQY